MNNLIDLWPGDWEEQLGNVNEVDCDKNHHQKETGKKRAVRKLFKNEFWKCIGCILLEVNYVKTEYRIWWDSNIYDIGYNKCIIDIDICGKK